ncbi:hypothetical protein SLA2020_340380 [Shorea laevis]
MLDLVAVAPCLSNPDEDNNAAEEIEETVQCDLLVQNEQQLLESAGNQISNILFESASKTAMIENVDRTSDVSMPVLGCSEIPVSPVQC